MSSNSATLVPTQQSVKAYVDSQVSSAGGNGISFEDNEKAQFGASNDLQIYHDGSNSYIKENGTGNLYLAGTSLVVSNSVGANYLVAYDGGSVNLYHNANQKLATTSTGIDVTGTVTADGLTVDGVGVFDAGTFASTDILTLRNGTNTNGEYIGLNFNNDVRSRTCYIRANHDSTTSQSLSFGTDSSGTATQRLKIDGNGDISFYDDTGSTQGLFWDASAERLGLGTTSPSTALHVVGTITADTHFTSSDTNTTLSTSGSGGTVRLRPNGLSSTTGQVTVVSSGNVGIGTDSPSTKLHLSGADNEAVVRLENSSTGLTEGDVIGSLEFYKSDASGAGVGVSGSLKAVSGNDTGAETDLIFGTSSTARGNNAEIMRLTGDGKVGIGTQNPNTILEIASGNSGGDAALDSPTFRINNTTESADWDVGDVVGTIQYYTSDASGNAPYVASFIKSVNETGNGTLPDGALTFGTATYNASGGATERMRIDSSGNLLVGTTDTTVFNNTTGSGVVLNSNGQLQVAGTSTPLYLNRQSTDGTIANFSKSGTTVGSIGIQSSGFYIDGESAHTGLRFTSAGITPRLNGAESDNTVNLGESGIRFKDLHLSGTANVGGVTSSGNIFMSTNGSILRNSGGALQLQSDASQVILRSNNTTALTLDTSQNAIFAGNIGIGTTTPAQKLHIVSTDGSNIILNSNTAAENNGIFMTEAPAASPYTNGAYVAYDGASNAFKIKTGTTTLSTRLTILRDNGNVGIGTDSPSTKLEVNGDIGIGRSAGAYTFREVVGGGLRAGIHSNSSNELLFKYGANTEGMRIDSSGRVGIGTSSPTYSLDVSSSSVLTGRIQSSSGETILELDNTNTNGRRFMIISGGNSGSLAGGKFGVYDATAGATRLAIDSSGNVGIGTTSPAAKLDLDNGSSDCSIRFGSDTGDWAFTNIRSSHALTLSDSDGTGEVLRVDTSGNLLVGTTDTSLWNNGAGGNTGTVIESDGTIQLAKSNNATAYFNRLDSDGDIVSFRKNGSSVGSIGTSATDLFIGTGVAGLRFREAGSQLMPWNTTTNAVNDSAIDIGKSDAKFKDLHLSGTAYTNGVTTTGNLIVGTEDNNSAVLEIKGGATGSSEGGEIRLDTAADHDGTYDFYRIDVHQDDFRIGRAGTTDITLNSLGRVGIGTSSPASLLSVSDGGNTGVEIIPQHAHNRNILFSYDRTGGGYKSLDIDALDVHFNMGGTEGMRIDSSGNVGIGTSSPDAKLEVSGGVLKVTNSGNANIFINANAVGSDASIFFEEDDNVKAKIQHDASNDSMLFTDGAYADTMTLKGAKVGIGTTSPSAKLEVNGYGKFTNSDNSPRLHLTGGRDYFLTATSSGLFGLYDNTASSYRLAVDTSGNIGIGTTAPETPLHVSTAKSSVTDSVLTLQDTTETFGKMIEFVGAGSTDCRGIIGFQEPEDNAPELYIANGGVESSGNGVGLAFWSYITVNRIIPCDNLGALRDNAIDLGSSNARFDDIYATNGTIQTSDRNDKQDIEEITDAETRVAVACKGLIRKFRWKSAVAEKDDNSDSDETARIHFGIIAQDLQDAFTAEGLDAGDYAMFTSQTWEDSDGVEQTRLGVRYSELLAFIIAAI
jgi:hypothetical protein